MLLRLVKLIVVGAPQRGRSSTVLSAWTRIAVSSAAATSRRASTLRVGQASAKAVTAASVGACVLGLVEFGQAGPGLVDFLLNGLAPALVLRQVQSGCAVGVGVEQPAELGVGSLDHLAEPASFGLVRARSRLRGVARASRVASSSSGA